MNRLMAILSISLTFAGCTSQEIAALTGTQCSANSATSTSGLMMKYDFNEGSGGTAYDTINGFNLTLNNASWGSGRTDGAVTLDGTSGSFLNRVSQTDFNLPQFTFEAWVYVTNTGTPVTRTIVDKGGAYFFHLDDGNTWPKLYFGATTNSSTTAIAPSAWVYLAATYDGTNSALYINGTQIYTAANGITVGTNSSDLVVGKQTQGKFDSLKIWQRALSSSEILQNYNAESCL